MNPTVREQADLVITHNETNYIQNKANTFKARNVINSTREDDKYDKIEIDVFSNDKIEIDVFSIAQRKNQGFEAEINTSDRNFENLCKGKGITCIGNDNFNIYCLNISECNPNKKELLFR